jgi:hypothetical protein
MSKGLAFRITHQDRTKEVIVDADRALIGSAAHCEVRLENAAREHAAVAISEDVIHLFPHDGAQSTWAEESPLQIGDVTITAKTIDLGSRDQGRSPFWLFVPALVVAIGAIVFYARKSESHALVIPPAPPLFDAPNETCSLPQNDLLPALAAEKLRLAMTRRERGAFSIGDAVDAVPLFETAAACFRVVGDNSGADDATRAAQTLRMRLEEEFHVRRVRLEHAFRLGDAGLAKHELAVLLPMTARRKGPYVEWLVQVDRQASIELDRQAQRGIMP